MSEANTLRLEEQKLVEIGKTHYLAQPPRANEALECFDTAIERGLENAEVYGLRGWCLQKLDHDFEAIDDFTMAIWLDPEDSNLLFQRSISKSSTGDRVGCVADLHRAIRISKDDTKLNSTYDIAAREMGNRHGISALYESALIRAKLELEQYGDRDERRFDLANARRRQLDDPQFFFRAINHCTRVISFESLRFKLLLQRLLIPHELATRANVICEVLADTPKEILSEIAELESKWPFFKMPLAQGIEIRKLILDRIWLIIAELCNLVIALAPEGESWPDCAEASLCIGTYSDELLGAYRRAQSVAIALNH